METGHQQWRYAIETYPPDLSVGLQGVRLDSMGAYGWELVGIDGDRYIFKRPR